MRRDEVSKQIAGFQQQWFGRMHRIDKFFHRVKPPSGATMNTHKGAAPCAILSLVSCQCHCAVTDCLETNMVQHDECHAGMSRSQSFHRQKRRDSELRTYPITACGEVWL